MCLFPFFNHCYIKKQNNFPFQFTTDHVWKCGKLFLGFYLSIGSSCFAIMLPHSMATPGHVERRMSCAFYTAAATTIHQHHTYSICASDWWTLYCELNDWSRPPQHLSGPVSPALPPRRRVVFVWFSWEIGFNFSDVFIGLNQD